MGYGVGDECLRWASFTMRPDTEHVVALERGEIVLAGLVDK